MSEATQVVAIDGPAGAGKSSVAREVARKLAYTFLDTGAMYRSATWWVLHKQVPLEDQDAIVRAVTSMDLQLENTDQGLRVVVNGHDVSEEIRTPEVTRMISKVDTIPAVRRHLVELQRKYGESHPVVAEGRDIGTIVFPKAACKIYLDADPGERARRRADQMRAKGQEVDEAALKREIEERDQQNMTRQEAPLVAAEDAIRVDTTGLSFDEVVDKLVSLATERLSA